MKYLILLSAMLSSLAAYAGHGKGGCPEAWHEWGVFGKKSIYLSHLPMFSSIHSYQIIIEVALNTSQGDVGELYLKDRRAHPDADYTLSPGASPEERIDYVLPKIIEGKKSFPGYLHRSNPDNSETILARNIEVQIKRVVIYREFKGAETKPSTMPYILFGNASEAYLAHFISGSLDHSLAPPAPVDFDQIVSATVKPSPVLTGADYEFFKVEIDGRDNEVKQRLRKENVVASLKEKTGSRPIKVQVDTLEHYQEKISRQN